MKKELVVCEESLLSHRPYHTLVRDYLFNLNHNAHRERKRAKLALEALATLNALIVARDISDDRIPITPAREVSKNLPYLLYSRINQDMFFYYHYP